MEEINIDNIMENDNVQPQNNNYFIAFTSTN